MLSLSLLEYAETCIDSFFPELEAITLCWCALFEIFNVLQLELDEGAWFSPGDPRASFLSTLPFQRDQHGKFILLHRCP